MTYRKRERGQEDDKETEEGHKKEMRRRPRQKHKETRRGRRPRQKQKERMRRQKKNTEKGHEVMRNRQQINFGQSLQQE
ncbi:hypothetical protein PBY51_018385 [Eleginops maclovinus]|uniref:Uncharacterized protein n=1 Tax=Eleginops maclovinus TaxID=56733 RepID=A0AAN7Y6D6_ELEMC|nr:hypothetical protein PBY51_018385 [Eleginops maclovinus]